MTKQELQNLLQGIEWEDFEVKSALTELPKSIWETVSAFLNTSGGWIALGVVQKGKKFFIEGLELTTLRYLAKHLTVQLHATRSELSHKKIFGNTIAPSYHGYESFVIMNFISTKMAQPLIGSYSLSV